MANSVMEQGEKYIHKQKKKKQWLIAVACVAVVAVSGTIAGLMLNGHALNHTKRVLDCKLEVHEHEERCYSQEEGEENLLICGYADYVVHLHNDDCYSEDGQLACRLPEIKPHEHSEECYKDQEFLICEQEEIPGHTHGEGCYEMRPVEAAAQEPQDTEGAGPEGTQTEGAEPEAEGTEPGAEGAKPSADQGAAVEEEPVLVCTQEEIEGHQHGDNCYETRRVLACGKLELHTHDEKLCFEEVVDKAGNKHQNLICEEIVLYEHIHGEDCFAVVELTGEEVDQLNEANKDQQLAEGEEGQGEDNPAEGEEGQGEDDPAEGEAGLAEGGEAPEGETEPGEPQEPEEKQFQKVYEDEAIKVTASYNEDAGIPEEAELVVQPAAEDAEADPAEAEAVQALLGEKEPSAKMSYTIGFFVDGQEIEPTGVVTITVQLPEGQQVAPGAPVTVIHYGENGPEAIQGSNVMEKDGKLSVSFDSSAFSKFMIVIGEPEEEPAGENPEGSGEENGDNGENPDGAEEEPKTETVSYKLSDSFLYENDDFRLTLRVVGTATAEMPVEPGGEAAEEGAQDAEPETEEGQEKPETEEGQTEPGTEEGQGEPAPQEADTESSQETGIQESGAPAEENVTTVPDADADKKPDAVQEETAKPDTDAAQKPEDQNTESEGSQTEEEIQSLKADEVELELKFLEQKDATYQEIQEFARKDSGNGELLDLSVMHYDLIYQGVPLDISECDVRVEVALKEKAAQTSQEADPQTETASDEEEPAEDTTAGEAAGQEPSGEGDASAQEPEAGPEAAGQEPANEAVIVSLILDNGTEYETADSKNLTADGSSALVMKAEKLQNGTLAMSYTAGEGPEFTVQYYARLDQVQYGDNGALDIIDTSKNGDGSGSNMPTNGSAPAVKKMVLEENGGFYTPATEKVLTKIFEVEEPYQFYISQNLENVDILYESDSYTRREIWVLKEGGDPESNDIEGEDWLRFTDLEQVKFVYNGIDTSDPATNTISIQNGTVLRLVYDPKESTDNLAAMFYDYDITSGSIYESYADSVSGKNPTPTSQQTSGIWHANTVQQGINSSENYSGGGAKLAFGNANTGTGLENQTLNGYFINQVNKDKKCSFGIVSGLNNGIIQYSNGIVAPKLFNEGGAHGKTDINDWLLHFDRVGDTYTFKSVEGTGGVKADNLDRFFHPESTEVHTKIYTNNFWPMDASDTFGADGHDLKFGDLNLKKNRRHGEGEWKAFPNADDAADHNAYFGMQFAINFNYTETYCGPLEYCFFGDDDMWVFLDGKLICDIGGVHSSVGEYVNLWDHLTSEDAGEHTLQVFYTERGASGSTCYIQFTLPSVSSAPLDTSTGILMVEKQVDGPYDGETEFSFQLTIEQASMYPYRIFRADKTVKEFGEIGNNQPHSFTLKKDERIEVNYLPVGTRYTVTEADGNGYSTTVSVNGGEMQEQNEASGTIINGSDKVVYINHTSLELPKTGGFGVIQYTFGGIAVTAAGLMYGYQWKRRRERRNQK